ncbi:hypothetical protein D3C75_1114690 [compost metagenome]
MSRANHPRFIVDEIKDYFIIPSVISHGKTVNTHIEKVFSNRFGYSSSSRSILTIGNNDVGIMFCFEQRKRLL